MFEWICLILAGFVLLVKGADFLVDGASNVAKKFHIPEIIIGLTIVSIGTSMPELFVSVSSALEGYSDISVGNVVGSNIANLLLILGVSSILKPVYFQKETRYIEIPMCLGITILFMVICNHGLDVSRVDGTILLFVFLMFIIYTIVMTFKGEKFDKEDNEKPKDTKKRKKKTKTFVDIIKIILGIVFLRLGGDLTVNNAVNVANYFHLSEKIISITILAIGTSLPELVTSVSAAIKGESDIAIGNIIGSNIFNMLLIIGTSAVIKPITYNISYNFEVIILIIATVMLSLFNITPPKSKMSRLNGTIFFLMYVGYMISLFV